MNQTLKEKNEPVCIHGIALSHGGVSDAKKVNLNALPYILYIKAHSLCVCCLSISYSYVYQSLYVRRITLSAS